MRMRIWESDCGLIVLVTVCEGLKPALIREVVGPVFPPSPFACWLTVPYFARRPWSGVPLCPPPAGLVAVAALLGSVPFPSCLPFLAFVSPYPCDKQKGFCKGNAPLFNYAFFLCPLSPRNESYFLYFLLH